MNLKTEWARANRADGPKAYFHFSRWLNAATLESRGNPEAVSAIHETATGVLTQALSFASIINKKNPARKLAGIVATRKRLSLAVEAQDMEQSVEIVARLWYHVLVAIPLLPQVDAIALGQYAIDDLGFILRWVATGELAHESATA